MSGWNASPPRAGPSWGAPAEPVGESFVRVYTGKDLATATASFAHDAQAMAAKGFLPGQPEWVAGRSGCARYIVLGLYAARWKGDGSLTVTYQAASIVTPDGDVPRWPCPHCGYPEVRSTSICSRCGRRFVGPPPGEATTRESKWVAPKD
jgi:hypothetical protein